MKKNKLLMVLSLLPILGMATVPLTSCGNKDIGQKCIISFTSSEGVTLSSTQPVEVKEKTKWKDVKVPTYTLAEGYVASGWYNVSDMVYLEDETEITKDITARLIAFKSEDVKINVTVKVDDKTYGPVPFIKGGTFKEFKDEYPEMKNNPTKEHYSFDGWYIGSEKLDDDSIFLTGLSTLTIEAKFNPIVYTVSTTGSSSSVTFDNLPQSINDGQGIDATYSYDELTSFIIDSECDIKVNGQSIKDEEGVVYANKQLKIPANLINGNVEIKIVAKSMLLINSLSDIISFCDQHEAGTLTKDEFVKKFATSTAQIQTEDELIGRLIKITINNKQHIARIIDVDHDVLTSDSSKKAALTFELVTLLSDSNGNKMTSKWDTSNNYDYTNSILRANLTGQGNGTKSFSSTVFSMLQSELQSGIKSVTKEVATTSGYTVNEYNDTLFPLTYTEMAQSEGSAKLEGSVYKYWNNHNDNKDRVKIDVNGNGGIYCLSSPSTDTNAQIWSIFRDGHISTSYVNQDIHAVSFAFCI